MSSEPISTEVSWLFGSTGGTTPTADAVALGEAARVDRQFFVAMAEIFLEPIAADRAEVALDMHAEHLLELAPQMARDQMQRLLVHRAAFDRHRWRQTCSRPRWIRSTSELLPEPTGPIR